MKRNQSPDKAATNVKEPEKIKKGRKKLGFVDLDSQLSVKTHNENEKEEIEELKKAPIQDISDDEYDDQQVAGLVEPFSKALRALEMHSTLVKRCKNLSEALKNTQKALSDL